MSGVVVAQEKLFQSRRLADQAAHTGVAQHPDEFPEALAVDLCTQRVALAADVLDALDASEIAGLRTISALMEVRLRCRIESSEPLSMARPARMMVTV